MKKMILPIVIWCVFVPSLWAQAISIEADFSIVFSQDGAETTQQMLPIYGYGFSRARNRQMAQMEATANANSMIAMQSGGNPFQYTTSNGSTAFSVGSSQSTSAVRVMSTVPAGGSLCVTASADTMVDYSSANFMEIHLEQQLLVDGPMDGLIQGALNGMMQEAVIQAIEESGLQDRDVSGTLYLKGLNINF